MTQASPANSIWFEGRAGRVARVAILTGVLLHLAGFFIFRVVAEPEIKTSQPNPKVSVASSSKAAEALIAMAELADSEPLFLPTRWNATTSPVQVVSARLNASPFDTFPPEIALDSATFKAQTSPRSNANVLPEEVLTLEPGTVFSTFGSDLSLPPVEQPKGPVMEIYDFETGQLLGTYPFTVDALGETAPESWRFAEFQVFVEDTGLLGDPLLVTSTDQEELDRALGRFLLRRLKSDSLAPGYYRIVIGP